MCCQRLGLYILISALFNAVFCHSVGADVASEDEIKAAYLYHILHFVEWPAVQNAASDSSINICVMDSAGNNQALKQLGTETISKHPVSVRFITWTSRDFDCHLLFVKDVSYQAMSDLLRIIGRKGVLTVGDSPGFAKDGGMIGFVIHEGSVRIEINLRAATNAGLIVSAKLLEVAESVIDIPESNL